MTPPPPRSTLFPYTTLFRSSDEEPVGGDPSEQDERPGQEAAERGEDHEHGTETRLGGGGGVDDHAGGDEDGPARGDPHRPAEVERGQGRADDEQREDRKSTRLNSR